jgi:thiosulfate/3-mercaptopyruvate sulfurtransferase
LEVWEKVFLKDADFMQDTHGSVGCVICHGGDSSEEGKEAAHVGLVIDPSPISCLACHSDIAHADEYSLHATQSGFISAFEARGGDISEGSPLMTAFGNHCAECHTTCGQCHVSRPDELGGGLVSSHEFRETPSMQYNCIACHGARIGAEYLGENEGYPADVHWTEESMLCTDCHGTELHGSGSLAENRYSNPNAISCEDCHEDVWLETGDNPQHEQHLSDLSCQVCHSIGYKNCFECHIALDEEGQPCRVSEPSQILFEIGLNPIRSSERPYEYVVLRHVPTCSGTCDFYGGNLFPDFDDVPTWKYATPHNIQLNTPQNSSCDACHLNMDIFLTEDDIRPEELTANEDVIVTEFPEPVGE